MATEFGKYCRKLRVDSDELLKNMADKLQVTSAYLSAVENGKRKIPVEWEEKIAERYSLDEQERQNLKIAIDHSLDEISINLAQINNANVRDTAIAFARKFDSLSDDEIKKIQKILKDR